MDVLLGLDVRFLAELATTNAPAALLIHFRKPQKNIHKRVEEAPKPRL